MKRMIYFCKMQQKIVLIGGPSTGKTSVISKLSQRKHFCMAEVSRKIILNARKQGIDQLFLSNPLLFSQKLLEKREQQYLEADKSNQKMVFFDRGIPDTHAYMDYLKIKYPPVFIEKSKVYRYDKVFLFPIWKKIYARDNERYESYQEAVLIDVFLQKTYRNLGYPIIEIPFGTVEDRANFIIHSLL